MRTKVRGYPWQSAGNDCNIKSVKREWEKDSSDESPSIFPSGQLLLPTRLTATLCIILGQKAFRFSLLRHVLV